MSIDLPGAEGPVARRVLAALNDAGAAGAPPESLLPGLNRADTLRLLRRLAEEGEAVEAGGRWTARRLTSLEAGTVETLESGDAMLLPPGEGSRRGGPRDASDRPALGVIPRPHLGGARDGDRVLARRLRGRGRTVAGRRLPELDVTRVLRRRHTVLAGTLDLGDEGRRWLVPYDPKNRLEVEVAGGDELSEDSWVIVRLEEGGGDDARDRVRGRVIEVLGPASKTGTDVAVALAHYAIPEALPVEVAAAALALPEDPPAEDRRSREDLTGRMLVTIDGESARDFDDALSLERLDSGLFRLGVHIADVAHWVPEGSALDREAYRRGTSVYFPDRAVPMLPEQLSNGLCSLRPGVPRLAVSAFLDIDRRGRVVGRRFAETVIVSRARLTYEEVRRVLERPRSSDDRAYGEVLPLLGRLRELTEVLLAAREARGSVDFDLPEGDVTLDTDGDVVGIIPRQRHIAHRIVEEAMIAANEAVAAELVETGSAALFRVHDAPPAAELEELRRTLAGFGVTLPAGSGERGELAPAELQRVLREVSGRPEEEFITTLVLRTLTRALYSPECRGHYALASRTYTHFTSPIRRYPDLVVHRVLKTLLAGGGEAAAERAEATGLGERLPEIAAHTSTAERRAERAERDVLQWKKVRFLASRVGEHFTGRITGVQPFGLFVRLDELHVDGLVPVRTFGDDYYRFDAEGHRLVGEDHGLAYRLGDTVEVRLAGADERHRGLDLEIVRRPEPAGVGAGPRDRRG